ncbi:hypothetical protein TGAM01_v206573 [Trichoderma gamsii]|uniref:NACHT domain-containing protein n=1 Tax=Trichoderma gamsii TaxID=398673 RepID=A0A2P4ZK28_9HYPO|nr:hypothetical protein TGAM01_v206573 [Trichoderma gamsii]PON24643.1 hypothetical protein TGAM01_v206573 [Trichoderma gamsii]
MVAGKPSKPTSRDGFEIAIVCTRALEYDALCLLFDDFWDTDGDPFGRARGDLNTYTTGCMGNFNVVAVLLCSSGKAPAASAAASLRSSYTCIELLILAGICEGVPDANGEELLLGDVVISETVIEYDLGTQSKNTIERMHGRANKNIRNFTTTIKTERGYELLEGKVSVFLQQIQGRVSEAKYRQRRKAATYRYPGSTNDILFESTHRHRHYNSSQCACADYSPDEGFYAVCDQSTELICEQTGCEHKCVKTRTRLHLKNKLENNGDANSAQIPHIFLGRFGSGDTAFRSGIHRDSLAQKHNIIAFETEGAGVWDELPCIIVKGVSSYGDGHKSQIWAEWQYFAAAAAASVTRALIERYPQTDKSPTTVLKLQENKACLNALFITNPEDDKIRIEETKGGLLRDAYIWVTKSEEFVQWLEDPGIRLLWIKGDPGKGKTMLLCGIIDELKARKTGRKIYYFLCQATDIRLNNAAAILRGLLHMIVLQQPSLITCLRHEFDKSGKSAFEGANSWVVLSRIFEQMLRDDSLKDPIFVIDALDECVSDLAQILKVITQSSASSSRVKWLVSSRNYADIQETLATAENKSIMSLELNAAFVSTAIMKYIQHQLKLLSRKKGYTKSQIDHLEEYLSTNANGTFLWVALVCAQLEWTPRFDHLFKLIEFPVGLDQLYNRMMDRVCDSKISDFGRRVLAIATVTNRPLTTSEFASMINDISHDKGGTEPNDDTWEDVLGYCGSFLTMRNSTVYFVHQSAKDFIVKHAVQRLFPNGTEHVHREILEMCISAMRSVLKKDMYNLVDPAFSVDDLPQRALDEDPLISVRYGCVHWIDHFEKSMPNSKDQPTSFKLINAFLEEKFIYWLEALSLLRNIFDGIAAMQRLEHLVANSGIPELRKRVWDARRFIQTFDNAIADYPLQVYVSALIFSPTKSITRQRFKHEAPEWIHALPNGESEWAPASRTYGGNKEYLSHLAASCGGTWIASAGYSTIAIWETFSGKLIRALPVLHGTAPGEERAQSRYFSIRFCFSPCSRDELASSWFDYPNHKLMIWDIATGKATQQLPIENMVKSISYLASAHNILGCLSKSKNDSDTRIIASIWNTETGQMIERLQLDESSTPVSLSIFSTVNKNIIAQSRGHADQTHVEIFNIDTGSKVHVTTDHINDIKFSPDGSLLAVRISSRTIAFFDTASGEIKWSFESSGGLIDFAFSPDGTLLAASTSDGIQILSMTSSSCLRTIRSRSNYLIFSHDGQKIYSVDYAVINVVEMDQESFIVQDLLEHAPEEVTVHRWKVSLSPNCKLVASMSIRPTGIKLLDIDTNTSTNLLENTSTNLLEHPYGDQDLTNLILKFSPDSEKLVFISSAMVKLWDVSSKPAGNILTQKKTSMFTFRYALDPFPFSPNSARLAIPFRYQNLSVRLPDTLEHEKISKRLPYALRVQFGIFSNH